MVKKELFFKRKNKNIKPKEIKKENVKIKENYKSLYTSKKIDGFMEKNEASNIGPGKRKRISLLVPKLRLVNIKIGNIIKEYDGLYIIRQIHMGCSASHNATLTCEPFNPKSMDKYKILIPK